MTNPRPPLPDVSKFFDESWRLFRARIWRLLTIAGLGSVGAFAGALIPVAVAVGVVSFTGISPVVAWTLAAIASLSILLWLMSWVQVAMIECAVAEEADASPAACYKRGRSKVAAFSWVCVLYMALVLGASFEFVLPGLFLAIALLFAPFLCVIEGTSGIAALKLSLDDTRGYFFPVLVRTGLAGLATSAAGMVPVVGWIISAVVGPFTLISLSVLARDLRRARPQPPEPSGRGWLLGVAAAGLVVPTIIGVAVIPKLAARAPQVLEAAKRMADNPQDPAMPQKILAILQGEASTGESLTTAASLAQQFSGNLSSATAPAPSPATAPAAPPAQ